MNLDERNFFVTISCQIFDWTINLFSNLFQSSLFQSSLPTLGKCFDKQEIIGKILNRSTVKLH